MSEENQSISRVQQPGDEPTPRFRTLRELIDQVTGREHWQPIEAGDAGLAELLPFPFLALVGQREMKLALLIALVNPAVGGVLLIGPRGTGKTTAVRSLVDLLPHTPRSLCYYGCMPEDIEIGGIEAVCPDCARKYGMGEPLVRLDKVHLVELPLNARLDDVVGGVDERLAVQDRVRIRKGILAQADRNLLFVDEVNLLADDVVDAILDAAAQGSYTVRRGPLSATYRSRFVLIGSMNPEEGRLRPQIMDRFGLRVVVHGLRDPGDRLEVYRRVQAYQAKPRSVVQQFAEESSLVQAEIQSLRDGLPQVRLPDSVAYLGLDLVNRLKLDSSRAEITMFEAARAYTALDGRNEVTADDLLAVAPMTLRMRRSVFMDEYFSGREIEEKEMSGLLNEARNQWNHLKEDK
jgi:magnesium chelatase subunit I